jgi:hypothetical protein
LRGTEVWASTFDIHAGCWILWVSICLSVVREWSRQESDETKF